MAAMTNQTLGNILGNIQGHILGDIQGEGVWEIQGRRAWDIQARKESDMMERPARDYNRTENENISDRRKNSIDLQLNFNRPEEREVYMPQELLRHICSYLELDDLRRLRYVSRGYNDAAAVYMFRTLKFNFAPLYFERVLNVTQNIILQQYVMKLDYSPQWSDIEQNWTKQGLDGHWSNESAFDVALRNLPNLKAIEFCPPFENSRQQYDRPPIGDFDPLWSFLKSSLRNLPKLRSITISTTFPSNPVGITDLGKHETEALGRLFDLSLTINHQFGPQLPTLLSFMSNLRSLHLKHLIGGTDISELVHPDMKFPSLVSLQLDNFKFNEQYFKRFLLANARSLRSLSLRNMKLEITQEKYDDEEYIKSNEWIRMFYFLDESDELDEIELQGKLELQGKSDFAGKGHTLRNLMLRLEKFITNCKGSPFIQPNPAKRLNNFYLQMTLSENHRDSLWCKDVDEIGIIRLLEREPSKPFIFRGFLTWGDEIPYLVDLDIAVFPTPLHQDDESQADEPQDDEPQDDEPQDDEPQDDEPQDDESQDDEDQDDEDQENYSDEASQESSDETPQNNTFSRLKSLLQANKNAWTDDERDELAALMGEDPANVEE
ncbi:hypothetical protein NHQ30_009354 [Ciborinia camelliae]|nr:hypothetical protein NHQ30_009354 [Ciborinia camelliae]